VSERVRESEREIGEEGNRERQRKRKKRMKRGGYYSAHTLGAAKVIENALTLGTRALMDPSLALPVDRRPFVIADYGYEDAKFVVCCLLLLSTAI